MKALVQYVIPVSGLRDGMHEYQFQVDTAFFEHFEDALVKEGEIDLKVWFDKRPNLYTITFDFEGTVKTACDRCLETINLPIQDKQTLMVKLSEEGEDDADMVFVSPHTKKLNIAKYVYEYISLAVPMIKVYDCENDEEPPCNEEMLDYLDGEGDEEPTDNPIWESLKNLGKE